MYMCVIESVCVCVIESVCVCVSVCVLVHGTYAILYTYAAAAIPNLDPPWSEPVSREHVLKQEVE